MGVATLNRTVNRINFAMNGLGGARSAAAFVAGLRPAAWFRFGAGITSAGGLVSQWDDQSGNGRHLKQATGTNQPALQADGSILFDGVDNYLKCDAFTLNQPETLYILAKQPTWTTANYVCDGNTGDAMVIEKTTTTPTIRLKAPNGVATNTGWTVDVYAVLAAVYNGASSSLQVNNGTPSTGDAGANNASGFTLGASATPSAYSNIQVKEVILYAAAQDATTRARVIRYLSQVGQLGV